MNKRIGHEKLIVGNIVKLVYSNGQQTLMKISKIRDTCDCCGSILSSNTTPPQEYNHYQSDSNNWSFIRIEEPTEEEKLHLLACIKANKFVNKEDKLKQIDNYKIY